MFSADGERLLTLSTDRVVRSWPIRAGNASPINASSQSGDPWVSMTPDASGRLLALSGFGGNIAVLHLSDGRTDTLRGFPATVFVSRPVFGEGTKLVAAAARYSPPNERLVRVWNRETGDVSVFGPWTSGERLGGATTSLAFIGSHRLLASIRGAGIMSLNVETRESRVLVPQYLGDILVSADGRFGVAAAAAQDPNASHGQSPLLRFDLETGRVARLATHGSNVTAFALDPTGTVVATGSYDGVSRIGPSSGAEPHLLLGQELAPGRGLV